MTPLREDCEFVLPLWRRRTRGGGRDARQLRGLALLFERLRLVCPTRDARVLWSSVRFVPFVHGTDAIDLLSRLPFAARRVERCRRTSLELGRTASRIPTPSSLRLMLADCDQLLSPSLRSPTPRARPRDLPPRTVRWRSVIALLTSRTP
jgi:hypothetical protein